MADDDMPPFGEAEIIALVFEAAKGDYHAVGVLLSELGERGGLRGLYALSCGIAEVVVRLGGLEPGEDQFVGFEVDNEPGNPPCDDGRDPLLWAARMVCAVGNEDFEQALALFRAQHSLAENPREPRDLVLGILALVNLAALLVRREAAGSVG